jgi:hypothetical protein
MQLTDNVRTNEPQEAAMMSTDPMDVETARARLAEAEALLDDATLTLLSTQPVWIDGVRYGGLNPLDETIQEAIDAVLEAEAPYQAAWEDREVARQLLEVLTCAAPHEE